MLSTLLGFHRYKIALHELSDYTLSGEVGGVRGEEHC